jgi:hypothetical protein
MASKYDLTQAVGGIKKRVGRSMVFTVCDGSYHNGSDWCDYTDTLLGIWSPERATRYLRKLAHDQTIQIVHTTTFKQYVDMSLTDFWLNANATSDPVQVQEQFITKI